MVFKGPGCDFIVYSALSDDASTVSQFTRRKTITVTTGGTSTPVNYQVKLTIAYETEMQADFDDIRFNTLSGGYIDYWIESYTASTTATVWVELPDTITDPGSDTIWMYYGNDGLSDGGNGDDVFEFFDDFSVDLSKWTIVTGTPTISGGHLLLNVNLEWIRSTTSFSPSGNILDFKYLVAGHYSTNLGWSNIVTTGAYPYDDDCALFRPWSDINVYTRTANEGTYTQNNHGDTYTHVWKLATIKLSGSSVLYEWEDGLYSDLVSTNIPNEDMYIEFQRYAIGSIEIDDVRVRKYITNEPTPSYGTAQHQRKIPQFIG